MFLLLLAAIVSPPASGPHRIGGRGAPLRESDAGRVIPAGRGTTVVILLNSNAGTGYRWRFIKLVNASAAGPISTASDPATPPGMVGGPLLSTALCRLDHVGRAEIVLALDPPGQGRAEAKILRYRFAVR